MSIETTPPSAPASAAPGTPAKKSHLLLKVLGGIVLLFVLKSMFSSKSSPAAGPAGTTASDGTNTAAVSVDDSNPLIGAWTLDAGQDASYCAEKVEFTKSDYFATLNGVRSGGATTYSGNAPPI